MFGSGDLGMGISITLIDEFSEPARRVTQGFATIDDTMARVGAKTFLLNQLSEGVGMLQGALLSMTGPGEVFDQSLTELSALTGVAGAGLDDISNKALDTAKKFGGDASGGVDTFKAILGKLGPEIAQNSGALQTMGNDAFILSKTMSNDLGGATEALTTSMNIYAGSMTDPILMAQEMTRQMNVMAAGAKVGSAEVTDIAASIKTGGLAAKSANVSFEELNALIQIMGKGAVYGSEAGIAIRNVLGIMSQGEYLPKKALEGLKAAGVDLNLIGDQALPIEQRLREISKIQDNAALVNLVFGRENSNAFRVLAGNLGLMGDWTAQMTGTNEATDQAAIVMQSFSEKMRRVKATVQGYAIDLFMATKAAIPYVQVGLQMVQGAVSLAPAYVLATEALAAFRASTFMTNVANVGLIATFEGLAVAAWAALAPLLPFIAIAAAVAAVIWLGYRAVSSFKDLMAGGVVETGFFGMLQQLGGIIMGVIEAFQSWDGATFSLSENMRANLEKIGVLDFVLRLATWVVRIKEFFGGLADGLSQFAENAGSILFMVLDKISPVTDLFDGLSLTLKKLGGDTWDWMEAGRALGSLLEAVWTPLIYLVAGAIGVLVLAFDLVVAILQVLIFVAIETARALGQIWDAGVALVSYMGGPMWQDIINGGQQFVDWLFAIPDMMLAVGLAIVNSIGQGISNAWGGLAAMLLSLVHELPFGDQIADFFGLGGGSLSISREAGGSAGGAAGIGATMAQGKSMAANPRQQVLNNTTEKVSQVTTNVILDGDVIHTAIKRRDQLDDARN